MLYIVTALYEEALPFLQKYNLKRQTDFLHFELFANEDVLLLITRPGALRAAAAVSSLLTAFPPGQSDLLLSVGCAGCADARKVRPDNVYAAAAPALSPAIGQAFTICRITDAPSGRTRYPELLYRSPFPQAEVITFPSVQTGACGSDASGTAGVPVSSRASGTADLPFPPLPVLCDMEAAGVYEAAIPFLSCERMLFVKVVSDALTGLAEFSAEARRSHVTSCIAGIMNELTAWLDALTGALCRRPENEAFTAQEEEFYARSCAALRLSAASSHRLRQLMLYLKLSGSAFLPSMRELLDVPLTTPCRTKKEGLKYLEQLTEYYL